MKKIIVFLSMFLFAGGILMAQTPKLSYEVLLRDDANNLLYEQSPIEVDVFIYDREGVTEQYREYVTGLSTDANGILHIEFGEGVNWESQGVDWSNASIGLDIFCPGRAIHKWVPVYAVPYAMQAGNVPNALTTDGIIEYIGGINFENDARRILRALHENPNGLEQDLVDSITNYLKAHKAEAVDGFLYYVDHLTAGDVQSTYNTVLANADAYERGTELWVDYAKHHMDEAIEIAEYFVNIYNRASDEHYVDEFIAKVKANTQVYPKVKAYYEDIFKEYLDENNYIQKTECPAVDPCTIAH